MASGGMIKLIPWFGGGILRVCGRKAANFSTTSAVESARFITVTSSSLPRNAKQTQDEERKDGNAFQKNAHDANKSFLPTTLAVL